jgi:phosphoribosylanthranilate isomerase
MIGSFGDETNEGGRTRVKICGITSAADAMAAIDAGADALGFNLFPGSKRYIDISSAGEWMAELPRTPAKVAVLVNPTKQEAIEVAELPFIDALQLHGDESREFCQGLAERGIRFFKAFAATDAESLRDVSAFFTQTVLLDSRSEEGFGGSGQTFPWNLARACVENLPELKIILAGGLTPENVAEAIRQVRPFAVDVTSGVESLPGRKDPARVRAFVAAVRAALA